MRRQKQHRRGRTTSRKIANLEAVSQHVEEMVFFKEGPVIFCSGCKAEITSADYEAGKCTQCQTLIGTGENQSKILPVNQEKCPTCPFREGSKYGYLAADLAISAMSESSRICHSTGTNAIGGKTGKPEKLCRGARDIQLKLFCSMGVISEPTDESWKRKCDELGIT